MNNSEICKRLRKIRENNLQLTREKLAEQLDVTVYSIERLETGKFKKLNMELIIKISKLAKIPLDEIIHGPIDDNNNNIIRRIDTMLQTLTEKELKYMYNSINDFITFTNDNKKHPRS